MPRLASFAVAALVACLGAGCSKSTPTSPSSTTSSTTTTTTPTPPPPPPPPAPANLKAQGQISIGCFTGLCTQASVTVRNIGTGCATGTQATVKFFGGDGAGPQLGIDVPMGMAGGSLSSYVFYPGSSVTLVNLINFNDVRSAHTVYDVHMTWRDITCP